MISPDRSYDVSKLIMALAKAQAAITAPERNKTVKVTPRMGGASYSFKYATLSGIIEAIRKPFTENGLWFTQIIRHDRNTGFRLNTTLWHESGQFLSDEVPIITEGHSNQNFGSSLTYMKRYALSAMIGLAAEEDDDGNIADGNEIKGVSEKFETPVVTPVAPSVINPPKPKPKPSGPVNTAAIPVELAPDDTTNWLKWGQDYIAAAKAMPDMDHLLELEKNNATPFKNMQHYVPKMFSNLMVSLIKLKKEMEKANA